MLTKSAEFWLGLCFLLAGCERPPAGRAESGVHPPPLTRAAAAHDAWLENSAERAFEQARGERRLILADLWAPWCHTCLSMRAEVLNEQRLPAIATVVRLAIDTERAENELFLQRYPVVVWPTFYLIDPETRAVRGRWLGGATPEQLDGWLREGSRPVAGAAAILRQADVLASQRRLPEAEASYRAALGAAAQDTDQRSRAFVALISTLLKQKKFAECAELALAPETSLPPSVSRVDFAASALACAGHAQMLSQAEAVRRRAESWLTEDCETKAAGVSADDQADACENLREARQSLGKEAGAREAAERTLRVIEAASGGAPPRVQAIYDWHRTAALVYLGRGDEAVALLEERERALPESYNPPHYLARIYRDQKRWPEALSAVERALTKAYGPRRIALLGLQASLLRGAGRSREARALLEQQLSDYRALPAGQKQPDAEAAVQERLNELGSP